MKTIQTEAGSLEIASGIGRVVVNRASMLPHEARRVAIELAAAAREAEEAARASTSEAMLTVAGDGC